MRTRRTWLARAALLLMLLFALTTTAFAAGDPTDETGTKMIECTDCGTLGVVLSDTGEAVTCETCGGTGYVQLKFFIDQ